MNEAFRIRFTTNGEPLPCEIVEGGLRFGNESSATPRRMLLDFDGHGEATKTRMRFVQTREGWHPYHFPLTVRHERGGLLFSGVEPDTLPSGIYRGCIRLEDLILTNNGRFRVEVATGATTDLVLEATQDPRQVHLTSAIGELPAEIRRVLTTRASRIDGMPLADWIASPAPRASRKACLLNILARAAALRDPLLPALTSVFWAEVDRVYADVTPQCGALLAQLANDPRRPFYREGSPKAAIHRQLLTRAGLSESEYTLDSYRQEGKCGLQVVVGSPRAGVGRHVAEFDIDLGNPLQDVAGFVVHLGELVRPARTDHFALRNKLLKSCGDFVCYDIVTPRVTARVIT